MDQSQAKFQLILENLVKSKGGKLESNYQAVNKNISIRCAKGHLFEALLNDLRCGTWCDKCQNSPELNAIVTTLSDLDISCEKHPVYKGYEFDLLIKQESGPIYIDYDEEVVFQGNDIITKQKHIREKIQSCANECRIIRLDPEIVKDKDKLHTFLWKAYSSTQLIEVSDKSRYDWLFQVEETEPIVTHRNR